MMRVGTVESLQEWSECKWILRSDLRGCLCVGKFAISLLSASSNTYTQSIYPLH